MTFAWYGHLKHRNAPLFEAIVVSWLIVFGEHCFSGTCEPHRLWRVHRISTQDHSGVHHPHSVRHFCLVLSWERLRWNDAISFLFLVGAVVSAF
jgi:uncharacterized protein